MENGYLSVHVFIGDRLLPVVSATVRVFCSCGKILHELLTNENGLTETIPLPGSADHEHLKKYKVEVTHKENLREAIIHGVTIFPGITSTLPVQLKPAAGDEVTQDEVFIPDERGVDLRSTKGESRFDPAMLLALSLFRGW